MKLSDGKYYIETEIVERDNRINLSFPYNADLLDRIKIRFENRKWDPENKQWHFPITQRNLFQLEVLKVEYGIQPYKKWDKKKDYKGEIAEFCSKRLSRTLTPYTHQAQMVNQALNVGWFIWAAEMGTGKTLAAIILMEMCGINDWIWVGPKAPLVAVQLEFMKWKSTIQPQFVTYDGLKKLVTEWPTGQSTPRGLILDEISRCKTPAAQRTIAAKHLADNMRREHGLDCIIGGLSGSPAPKNPSDWWSICEVIAPGFIQEGNIHLFKQKLAIQEERETLAGAGKYNHVLGWRDDVNKCDKCGQLKDHLNHNNDVKTRMTGSQTTERHEFKPSINEVARLATRLNGLVGVWLKKDCLDLPMKRYQVVRIKPSRSILNAAKLITETSTRAVETLTRLRTLSDGFQYKETKINETECYLCKGSKTILEWQANGERLTQEEALQNKIFVFDTDDNGVQFVKEKINCEPTQVEIPCPRCDGTGRIDEMERVIAEVECGKDQALRDQLDSHEEVGRLVIFAGFTGSVDRVSKICRQEGWCVLRVDGRGWELTNEKGESIDLSNVDMLQAFQEGQETYPRLVFVAQPGAGGMGLTLTASSTSIFYSNDFNAESRIQAEDRIHRPGMSSNGGLIIDFIHLPSDEYVLDNLKKKRDLQLLSMTGLKDSINEVLNHVDGP